MTMRARLSGVFPPIPTVFDAASGGVDERAMASNVRRWMQTRLAGILALGSNGEAALLSEDECDRIVAAVRDAVPPDRVLIVGTGRESTRAAVSASVRAARLGADAVLVRAPSFFRAQMTPAALAAHYTGIADASPVPVLLYNLPAVAGFSFTVELVESLAAHPNVAGIKETSADLDRLGRFATIRPDRFAVLSGWAPVLYPALCAGAVGGILAVANVLPDACVSLVEHVRGGRHADALDLQRRLVRIAQLVSTIHGVAGLKAALDVLGWQGGPVRAPLLPLAPADREAIAEELSSVRAALEHTIDRARA
jgi:4-hydroxy-2-oxoglutarate aldolase